MMGEGKKFLSLFIIFSLVELSLSFLLLACEGEKGYIPSGPSVTVHIYRTVTDVADGSPISGVSVSLVALGSLLTSGDLPSANTNEEGFYSLKKAYFYLSSWENLKCKTLFARKKGYTYTGEPPCGYPVSNEVIQEVNIKLKKIED